MAIGDKKVNIVILARDTASGKLKDVSKATKGLAKSTSIVGKVFSSFATVIDKVTNALVSLKAVAVGVTLLALRKGLELTVGTASKAESQLKKLKVAMQSAGRFSKENLRAFEKLAVGLEKSTGFLEEDTLQALSILQTFGQMTREDMEKTIEAALNMSTIFGEDLSQSAIRLGKAYVGQLAGLQRVGISISAAAVEAEGFNAVLKQLAIEQGGQAVARMKGFEGVTKRIGIAFGEIGKELGKFITNSKWAKESLEDMADGLSSVSDWLRKKREADEDASEAVKAHTNALKDQEEALEAIGKQVKGNILHELKEERLLALKEKEEARRIRNRTNSQAMANKMLDKILALREKERRLDEQILRLEGDKNVEGSKANLQIIKNIRARKESFDISKKEEEIALKKGKIAFENLQKEANGIKLLIDRRNKLKSKEDIAFENLQKEANAVQLLIDKRTEQLKKEEDVAIKKGTIAFESLQKEAIIIQQFQDGFIKKAVETAQKEIEIRQRVSERLKDITAQRLRESLQDEELNETERKILLQEAEEEAEKLNKELTDGSKRSAEEVSNIVNELDRLDATLKDVDSRLAEDIRENINESFKEARELLKELPKITIDLDWETMILNAQSQGNRAGEEFRRNFEIAVQRGEIIVPVRAEVRGFGAE
jgi:hypothetical protein